MPIRVLNVFASLDRGGSLSMCMNYYRNIDRNKVQFDFITHMPAKDDIEDEIDGLGGRVFVAPRFHGYNYCEYLGWWKQHLVAHPEHKLIHGHYYTIAFAYSPLVHEFGRKSIVHSHSVRVAKDDDLLRRIAFAAIKRQTNKSADACFACSEAAGKWLFPNREFTVIRNAIEPQRFVYSSMVRERMRNELEIAKDCRLLVVVGGIAAQKNPQGIVSICRAVNDRTSCWKLVWCGGGSMLAQVEHELEVAGLREHVVFLGVSHDVESVLQGADAFLMPSLREGLSVAAIEAQAAGLSCFLGDNLDRGHNITGLCQFLPLGEWEAWADAIMTTQVVREDTSKLIRVAGYDVAVEASTLQSLYLDLADSKAVY